MTLKQSDEIFVLSSSLYDVLLKVSADSHSRFKIEQFGTTLRIACPFHSNGGEAIPSCYFNRLQDGNLPQGFCHCFGCGYAAPIEKFISDCFGKADGGVFGIKYLLSNFAGDSGRVPLHFGDREDDDDITFVEDIPPCVCEYLTNRGISEKIQKLFKTGLTESFFMGRKHPCVAFPIYYCSGRFAHYALRATDEKIFHYPSGVVKPVYGMNLLQGEREVFVTESIINALSLWTWGYPAIALNGTGTAEQFKELKGSGFRHYFLCFDGDFAGGKGIRRFKENLTEYAAISVVEIPENQDVNSIGRKGFERCSVVR